MRFVFSLLFLFLFSADSVAAETDGQRVLTTLKQSEYIKGEFTQSRQLAGIPRPIISKGEFIVWRDQGFYWKTVKPIFHATSFSGNKLFQWQDENTAVLLQEAGLKVNEKVSSLILAFFTANFSSLQENFDIKWEYEEKKWIARLFPKSTYIKKALQEIIIKGESNIENIRLSSAGGDVTDINLLVTDKGQQPNEKDKGKILSVMITECCVKR